LSKDERSGPIRRETLDILLQGYSVAGTRYLESAYYTGGGRSRGNFRIAKQFYYGDGFPYHFAEIDAALAFNQIAYATFSHLLEEGIIAPLGVISPESFLKLQTTGTWIKESRYEYNKPVLLYKTEGKFFGELAITELTIQENQRRISVKMLMDFDVESGSSIGHRDVRVIFPKGQ
jgi:hypothetical protein